MSESSFENGTFLEKVFSEAFFYIFGKLKVVVNPDLSECFGDKNAFECVELSGSGATLSTFGEFSLSLV
jgi:hypothetical protein